MIIVKRKISIIFTLLNAFLLITIFQAFVTLSNRPGLEDSRIGSYFANGHIRLRIFDGSFQIYSILQLQNCNSVEEFYANFLNLCGLHNQ